MHKTLGNDRAFAKEELLKTFDGYLPKDPTDIEYWEEMSDNEMGDTAAKLELKKLVISWKLITHGVPQHHQ